MKMCRTSLKNINMIKTYTLKMYPNKSKAKRLNSFVSFWRDHVNHKIKTLWEFDDVNGSYPPKEKGKDGRTKGFRRKHGRWAYNHLSKQLEQIGIAKGFSVIRVNPKYTSQTCPVCGFRSRENRKWESFKCLKCGFVGHADHVGAINISERVPNDNPYLKPIIRSDLL